MEEMTELRSLLAKEHGRAWFVLWQNGELLCRAALLEACQQCQIYDTQCESSRAPYLFELIQNSGNVDYYRTQILAGLPEVFDKEDTQGWRSRYQRLELTRMFAAQGNNLARSALYEDFESRIPTKDFSAGGDIVALDGIDGLRYVLTHIDNIASTEMLFVEPEEDAAYLDRLVFELEERDGDSAAWEALEQEARTFPVVGPLLAERRGRVEKWKHEREARKAAVREDYGAIRERILTSKQFVRGLMPWGHEATEEELLLAAQDMLLETDPIRLRFYLMIFHDRVFPLDFHPLFALVRSGERRLALRARDALANITHPDIRAFALELAQESFMRSDAVHLLVKNSAAGDYALLEAWLRMPAGMDEIHWFGIGVKKYVRAHPDPEAARVLRLLYDLDPCSRCREGVVDMLAEMHSLSEVMRQECLHDAVADIRKIAAAYNNQNN